MSDINYGNILEALNDKADRDLQNVTPPNRLYSRKLC